MVQRLLRGEHLSWWKNVEKEAVEIKKHLNNDEFLTSTASNGWLEKWKILYGEVGEVSREIVNAWMERLCELTKGYDPVDIWNINERAAF